MSHNFFFFRRELKYPRVLLGLEKGAGLYDETNLVITNDPHVWRLSWKKQRLCSLFLGSISELQRLKETLIIVTTDPGQSRAHQGLETVGSMVAVVVLTDLSSSLSAL